MPLTNAIVKDTISYVSFGFDNTLTLPYYDVKDNKLKSSNKPNPIILAEIYKFACKGWKIIIVSERTGTPSNHKYFNDFGKTHNIPIDGKIFTSGKPKAAFLANIPNLIAHYDYDSNEIDMQNGITFIKVEYQRES